MSQQPPAESPSPQPLMTEARWPILAAVVAVILLSLVRPEAIRVAPVWVLPCIEVVLLVALVASPVERAGRRAGVLRGLAMGIVGALVVDTLFATGRLVAVLVEGGKSLDSASVLLTAGAVVWAANVISFALLYWLLDAGGAAARAQRMPTALDLAFPQQLSPEVAPPGWRPRFIDYLYLGLTASTAFSPTDVMPLVPWAKVAMGTQALISVAVLGLVIARAVSLFT